MANDTVVLYPSPERGHIVAMVELAKLLIQHHPSISITIILITSPDQPPSTTSYISTVSATVPSISFIHLPTVSPPPFAGPPSFKDIVASFYELPKLNNPNLHATLLNLSKSLHIKAFVLDIFCNYATQISSSLLIPTYYFCTSGANGLCHLLYWPTIHKNFKDLGNTVDVPGTPSFPSKYLPIVMLDRSHKVYHYFLDAGNEMAKSAGLIINTFESLEPRAVEALVEGKCTPDGPAPPIYCIGPVVSNSESEGHECLTWLDSQPKGSVAFLSFGSMGVFSAAQLREMAIGIEKSGVRFLWVVRNPPADGATKGTILSANDEPNLETLLPEGFLDRTKGRGLVLKLWAPQIAVLNHESIGGFVTHCGWNSILESICAGVPMVAWPLYAEQKMNGFFLEKEMKLTLSVAVSENGMVSADELKQRITELMNSEKGKMIRERVMEMKEAAAVALSSEGTSRAGLTKLVESMTTPKYETGKI